MPVYEYLCNDCGGEFEINQSMRDLPVEICPECKGTVRRIISGGSGFILKSSGPGAYSQPRCGKTQTCCGSKTPCETPSCGHGE
jgi:putative FmdB family regulatory protein